jgi:hypothetical protein
MALKKNSRKEFTIQILKVARFDFSPVFALVR